jgi:hypothetical protein
MPFSNHAIDPQQVEALRSAFQKPCLALGLKRKAGDAMTGALLALLLLATPAGAQLVDGPHFLQQCLGQQPQGEAACTGYIAGTLDALLPTGQFCIPPPVAPQQIVLRTVDFLAHSQHEIGGLPGTQQVLLALKAIWPCVGRRPNVTIWMQPNHFKGGIQLW